MISHWWLWLCPSSGIRFCWLTRLKVFWRRLRPLASRSFWSMMVVPRQKRMWSAGILRAPMRRRSPICASQMAVCQMRAIMVCAIFWHILPVSGRSIFWMQTIACVPLPWRGHLRCWTPVLMWAGSIPILICLASIARMTMVANTRVCCTAK